MIPNTVLPWQETLWQRLWHCRQDQKLAHALLFTGAAGLGKKQFALALAHSLLCQQPSAQGQNCGTCRACYLLQAQSHPDLMLVSPEEDGRVIGVDQIREVVTFVNETAQQGGYRVIIIDPATAMNMNAANALLKTLEEPSQNVLFVLICDENLRLPATIMSRCQKVLFSKPDAVQAARWLQEQGVQADQIPLLLNLTQGAPLKAANLVSDGTLELRQQVYQGMSALSQRKSSPLQLAAEWQDYDLVKLFSLLLNWGRDLLRLKLTQEVSVLTNQDYQASLIELNGKISQPHLVNYLDILQQAYANVLSTMNLNRQLLLETILIKWTSYVSG